MAVPDDEAIEDHRLMYRHSPSSDDELQEKYPERRPNTHKTLPFHELLISLFNPLLENSKKKTGGPAPSRLKKGLGFKNMNPQEMRRNIIERFVSRWRSEVGDDFYPALRLILPEKDRDRAMYGLKEKTIGRLIVKVLKLNPKSDDAQSITNWKLINASSRMAGDFAGRCQEVLAKRAMRQKVGDMRIAEVNNLLDDLSAVSKEEDQLPIFTTFYNRMNSDELTWLIRIILRQMKIGATEKTFLDVWHPDGGALFNVSSSLRRVCWELVDPNVRLDSETKGITLMHCFQPQLAQFQMHSFQKMVDRMGCNGGKFWIEEKLDGERMQMHMMTDDDGVKRFSFWSRKGKDYTFLYGDSFDDGNSSLTRFIRDAFEERVESIILDGEMITWDIATDSMVEFGTLKSAAISEQRNPFQVNTGQRPLFRVFDCLYLNGTQLANYTLEDRHKALKKVIHNVSRRLEYHEHHETDKVDDIEVHLRKVVAESSEGLVLKNPNSLYQLNSRNDNWMKVKPEYMTEFGESLDCVVIGAYYGSGKKGGKVSSFLCGLRVNQNHIANGANPMKCYSFCRVGGGFRAEDYAKIAHQTDGKWTDWDREHPPTEYIVLGGGDRQYERPDQWIKPCDSVVLEVKAASVAASDQFGTKFTLRFPRFKRLRDDKRWDQALSLEEFDALKEQAETESKEKEFKVDHSRKLTKRLKKEVTIAGNDKIKTPYAGPKTEIFEGLKFCVMSDMIQPKKSKADIEQVIKNNGGSIFQSATAQENIICVGDRNLVKVASLVKKGEKNILRPKWIFDTLKQAEIDGPDRPCFYLPFEPDHMFFVTNESAGDFEANVDIYGDSFARDTNPDDLKTLLDDMIHPKHSEFSADDFLGQLEEHRKGMGDMVGAMFRRSVIRFVSSDEENLATNIDFQNAKTRFSFAGGTVAESDEDEQITHFVMLDEDPALVKEVRRKISLRKKVPRIVSLNWLSESWEEKTVLDEEGFAI